MEKLPKTTFSRRHLVHQWRGLWLASGRVLEGELVDLTARAGLRVVVGELSAPLLDLEAWLGSAVRARVRARFRDRGRVRIRPRGRVSMLRNMHRQRLGDPRTKR